MKERGLHSPDIGDAIAILIHIVSTRLTERQPSALPQSVAITQAHRIRLREHSGKKRGWNFAPKYVRETDGEGKVSRPNVLPWEKNRDRL